MKKAVKIFRIVFIITAVLTAAGAGFFLWKDYSCKNTTPPENMSATATVQKYFEYWNAGNAKAMTSLAPQGAVTAPETGKDSDSSDAAVDMNNSDNKSKRNYLPSLDIFCDIECSECTLLDEKAEEYKSYADNAIVSVNFTYEKSFGFGDESIPSKAENWEFHLVKETTDSDWRIISVQKG